jgi:hypothetical protein
MEKSAVERLKAKSPEEAIIEQIGRDFNLGTLNPGAEDGVTMYYGTDGPSADTDRERLVAAFETTEEAVKSSILADLDAFSALQAKYLVSLRNDWRDYVEVAWTIVDAAVVDPSDHVPAR